MQDKGRKSGPFPPLGPYPVSPAWVLQPPPPWQSVRAQGRQAGGALPPGATSWTSPQPYAALRSCQAVRIKPKRNSVEGGGLRGEHRGAGWRGGDRLLRSAGLSDSVPGGAGGATSVAGRTQAGGSVCWTPIFSLLIPCRLGAQLLGAGSAKRGGGAAGGRG